MVLLTVYTGMKLGLCGNTCEFSLHSEDLELGGFKLAREDLKQSVPAPFYASPVGFMLDRVARLGLLGGHANEECGRPLGVGLTVYDFPI